MKNALCTVNKTERLVAWEYRREKFGQKYKMKNKNRGTKKRSC